jgi:hypothetical protein
VNTATPWHRLEVTEVDDFTFRVQSESNHAPYFVDALANKGAGKCDCPDFQCRVQPVLDGKKTPPPSPLWIAACKHLLRVRLHVADKRVEGIDGERSGLWFEMARVVGEVGPAYVLVENSPMLTVRGLGRVLGQLSEMGYDARWGVFSAADVGARHERERLFVLAHTHEDGEGREHENGDVGKVRAGRLFAAKRALHLRSALWDEGVLRSMGVADGVAVNLDRIGAAGDGQVPAVVALAWRVLI